MNHTDERIKTVGSLIASIAIPLVVALIGHWYTSAIKQNEIGLRYVELSVTILSQKPETHTTEIRAWAIDTINEYSIVKMSTAARDQLLKNQLIESAFNRNLKSGAELAAEVNTLIGTWDKLNELEDKSSIQKPNKSLNEDAPH